MARLQGLVSVITGAGSGIGRASALAFAAEGACVVVADLDRGAAEETAASIGAQGGSASPLQVDVTDAAQVDAMLQHASERFGRLDVLFNNAGIPQGFTPVEESSDDLFERIMAVNVRGVFNGCRAAVPRMKAQGGGVILNTASTAGIRPRPGLAIYNASKAAVISLTKTLALEVAQYRIRVVSICPVATDTPMLATFLGPDAEEARERFVATVPWGRLNKPEDLARAAVFLASPEAEMVTGTAFEVDGGRDI
ncbi:MAG: SDR family oxidoreductase [Chloroflexi bacterium]|nr:SDR family oxidoreductase [Chloroflexota bacterium]MBV9601036.1 SDR family oxidoreductase [Chloroflexota bacterium]